MGITGGSNKNDHGVGSAGAGKGGGGGGDKGGGKGGKGNGDPGFGLAGPKGGVAGTAAAAGKVGGPTGSDQKDLIDRIVHGPKEVHGPAKISRVDRFDGGDPPASGPGVTGGFFDLDAANDFADEGLLSRHFGILGFRDEVTEIDEGDDFENSFQVSTGFDPVGFLGDLVSLGVSTVVGGPLGTLAGGVTSAGIASARHDDLSFTDALDEKFSPPDFDFSGGTSFDVGAFDGGTKSILGGPAVSSPVAPGIDLSGLTGGPIPSGPGVDLTAISAGPIPDAPLGDALADLGLADAPATTVPTAEAVTEGAAVSGGQSNAASLLLAAAGAVEFLL